jgi:O-methyltransferase
VGVWKGGTEALLCAAAAQNPRTRVYLADTFAGVVKASVDDPMYKGGEHADTSEVEVLALLGKIQASNFRILRGIFPDDLPPQEKIEQIKLCHIDVDTYGSAKDVLEYVWTRMVRGGVVVFDDYGFWGREGITRYVNTLQIPDARVTHNLNGHAVVIKV